MAAPPAQYKRLASDWAGSSAARHAEPRDAGSLKPNGGVMSANILVVEDDASSREVMASLLRNMGYEVTTTADAEEAMQHLYSESVCDAVLTDIVLPGMWGDEFASRAKEARPGLPVILLSGRPEGLASAMKSGSLALTKPVAWTRMVNVLQDALDHTS